jgi:hypothetical protein
VHYLLTIVTLLFLTLQGEAVTLTDPADDAGENMQHIDLLAVDLNVNDGVITIDFLLKSFPSMVTYDHVDTSNNYTEYSWSIYIDKNNDCYRSVGDIKISIASVKRSGDTQDTIDANGFLTTVCKATVSEQFQLNAFAQIPSDAAASFTPPQYYGGPATLTITVSKSSNSKLSNLHESMLFDATGYSYINTEGNFFHGQDRSTYRVPPVKLDDCAQQSILTPIYYLLD